MRQHSFLTIGLCGVFLGAATVSGAPEVNQPGVLVPIDRVAAVHRFLQSHPDNDFSYAAGNRIERVYGPAFSVGNSAVQSAEQFRMSNADLWGIAPQDLIPIGPFENGRHEMPLMYDSQTDTYKFTSLHYTQARDGVPVFRGGLILLVRNEAGFPLVLASSTLRDLGTFRPNVNAVRNSKAGFRAVSTLAGAHASINMTRMVIWAGHDDVNAAPVLAHEYIVEDMNVGMIGPGLPQRILYLADAVTGAILYEENQVHDVNVSGRVSGIACTGDGAFVCSLTADIGLPYVKVAINGGASTFADANGNFTIPNAGSSAVTVNSTLENPYFVVQNQLTATSALSQLLTPPGPANFQYDPVPNEVNAAEINTLIAVTRQRDLVLAIHPDYPSVATQSAFPIRVNINQTCNAFYSASTINFYVSGGGCTNTGVAGVAYHEFGHNLVEKAGSGQGAYGEGQSDVMAMIMSDNPCLGEGFHNVCGVCLRNASNGCLYPCSASPNCGTEIHVCGQLISGCVWSTRTNLQATNPLTYRQIIIQLAVNSMFLHGGGTTITPSITVDYLTLDDNDGDISNGTPHYNEINNGFTVHNMPGPPLPPLAFSYPNGKPAYISPSGGTTMRVVVWGLSGTPLPGSGQLFVDGGAGFAPVSLNVVSPNVYDAVFPAMPCGTVVRYYIAAQTTTTQTVTSPVTAPAAFHATTSGAGIGPTVFTDDFQGNLGWTISSTAIAGQWQRTVPDGVCNRGNPGIDADGSGLCYVSQVIAGNCNSDIDEGFTILTSPILNASQGVPVLSYWRWYDNVDPQNGFQDDAFVVEISINGGASWLPLETVGPTGIDTNGGWVQKSINLFGVQGFSLTNQFKVRFTAQDLGQGSIVEAGVDGVKIQTLLCFNACPGELTGNNKVDTDDLLMVINSWGLCSGCPADITGNGQVNTDDLLVVINGWGPCP